MSAYSLKHRLLTPVSADIDKFEGRIYEFALLKSPAAFDDWMRDRVLYELRDVDRDRHEEEGLGPDSRDDNYFMTIAHVHQRGRQTLKAKVEVLDPNHQATFDSPHSKQSPWKVIYITKFLGEEAEQPFLCAHYTRKKQLVIYLPRHETTNILGGKVRDIEPIDENPLKWNDCLLRLMNDGYIDIVPARMWAHDWHMDRDKEHFGRVLSLVAKGLKELSSGTLEDKTIDRQVEGEDAG
ncbi:hypothetical protein B0A55_01929 [Friedmanniomyces simplex]|uniref:Uncharacterized protein n=1 Tax=Friedmanniomyces simplex TaxID=329884 RepID=A0A4U0XVU6_9PEZI|nr:hypothetical protein B0A55_01929 [Friedmanniomyces simplex]